MEKVNTANPATRVEIDDPEQARLLTEPESFRYLLRFLPGLARSPKRQKN
jgi:hypothetical protein